MLCVGRVRNGGPVQLDTGATLEERIDHQIARNAEALAMLADLEAMLEQEQRREPTSFQCSDSQLDELLDAINQPGFAEAQPWLGIW